MAQKLIRAAIERGALSVDKLAEHPKGKGMIAGFAVLTKGHINEGDARDWQFDDQSLEQVVTLGNAVKQGVKSRFGHPNMSGDALGTFLGRAKNFRRDGDIVRADLYFDSSAYKTPNGDLASYVLDLASNDPSAFGTSMVFEAELEHQLDAEGKKTDAPAIVRFKKLFATDVVDDPAANTGMFGKFITGNATLSAEATKFLDKFLQSEDAVEKMIAFLERYRRNDEANDENAEVIMELKDITVDMLRKDRADIVDGLKAEHELAERTRAAEIMAKAIEYAGFESIALAGIKEGMSVADVEAKMKTAKLAAINAAAPASPGPAEGTEEVTPKLSGEDLWKHEFKTDDKVRDEFGTEETYIAFKKAEVAGRVRVMSKK